MKPIYLDYNASTPIHPEVAAAMKPYLYKHFGNPSSSHIFGTQAADVVEKARNQVAKLIRAKENEIVFTSGGTESNNFAIKGIAYANRTKGNHIITSQVEHPAVINVCKFLERNGFSVTYLPVDKWGSVSPEDVSGAITPATILVSIMHANNEVGTLQSVSEISQITKRNGIYLHTDAAQSLGKINVNVNKLGADLLSVAGHKLYAPKGVGALYIQSGTEIEKIMHGAAHERNMRAGTENVLEIVGLGKACEVAQRDLGKNISHLKAMRDLLRARIRNSHLDYKFNGDQEFGLPNTLNASFKDIDAAKALKKMSKVAASPGAACHSDGIEISSVLKAMQVPLRYARGTIRFSCGKFTTGDEIEAAAKEIIKVVGELQKK